MNALTKMKIGNILLLSVALIIIFMIAKKLMGQKAVTQEKMGGGTPAPAPNGTGSEAPKSESGYDKRKYILVPKPTEEEKAKMKQIARLAQNSNPNARLTSGGTGEEYSCQGWAGWWNCLVGNIPSSNACCRKFGAGA